MAIDHHDTSRLIQSLDGWFEILRRRYKKPMPLKPAKPQVLEQFRNVPDLFAIYGYTDGAWEDRKAPLSREFLPVFWSFHPLKNRRPDVLDDFEENGVDAAEIHGFDQLPNRLWDRSHSIFQDDHDTHQISILTGEQCFQAVARMGIGGLAWQARRLHEIFEWAIELEQAGELDWSLGSPHYVNSLKYKSSFVANPRSDDGQASGWRWEPID